MVPHTVENPRDSDETVCRPNDEEMLNAGDDVVDEFTRILNKECTPKVLIMASLYSHPDSTYGSAFISHLISVIPNSHYFQRGTCELKKVVQYANEKEFTSMIVVENKRNGPVTLLIIGLPDGPIAHFKLSNVRIPKEIKNHGKPTSDKPKLVLANFTTFLENRLGRMIQSLFPQDPVLRGCRVVAFHNRHDVIVFRHHRYILDTKEGKQTESKGEKNMDEKNPRERKIARLQECGPRFTLKLISLQRGGICASDGEYEWVNKHTMESDETVCRPDDDEEMLFAGNDVVDEFTAILNKERTPKILITTSRQSSKFKRGPKFISHLMYAIPNAHYFKRGSYKLKKIIQYANEKDYTSLIVVHNIRHEPDALRIIGLPDGPIAYFKLPKLHMQKGIKNIGKPTSHKPELVLTNFTTPLEHRVGRMIQSLFPQDPEFQGRRVVTFHKQRDVIVFRHHCYIYETKEGKQTELKGKKSKAEKSPQEGTIARLKELSPRFTLKLISIQRGTDYSIGSSGEFEWVHKREMDTTVLNQGQLGSEPCRIS